MSNKQQDNQINVKLKVCNYYPQKTYDLSMLKKITEDLFSFESITVQNIQQSLQIIKLIIELLVWGDENKDPTLFEYFQEKQILNRFYEILRQTKWREVIIEIIKSVGILLINIRNPATKEQINHNPLIHQFISYKITYLDQEVTGQYISVLKSLSLQLNEKNISVFFNETNPTFPLLSQAVKFYNFKDNLVRTHVKNVVLQVMRVKDEKLQRFLVSFPFVLFYCNYSCYLFDLWKNLDDLVIKHRQSYQNQLQSRIEDQIDEFEFIQEILSVGNQEIITIFINALMNYTIIPGLVSSLVSDKKSSININLALYLLNLLFKNISNQKLLEIIMIIFFGKKMKKSLNEIIALNHEPPISYRCDWKYTNFWDKQEELIIRETNDIFLNYLAQQGKGSDIIQSPKHMPPLQDQTIIKEVKKIHKVLGFSIIKTYQCDAEEEALKVTQIFDEFKTECDNEQLIADKNIYSDNILRLTLMSFMRTKDDTLLLLLSNLLLTIIKNESISNEALRFCGLLTYSRDAEGYKSDPFNLESLSCIQSLYIEAFNMEINYRAATIKNICKVLFEFSRGQQEPVRIFNPKSIQYFFQLFEQYIKKMAKCLDQQCDELVSTFEDESKQIEKDIQIFRMILSSQIFFHQDDVKNEKFDYKIPKLKKELVTNDIIMIYTLKRIKSELICKDPVQVDIVQSYNEYIQSEVRNWGIGEQREINKSLQQYQCHLIDTNNQKWKVVLIRDEHYLVLGELISELIYKDEHNVQVSAYLTIKVVYKQKYVNTMIMQDQQNSKRLLVYQKSTVQENQIPHNISYLELGAKKQVSELLQILEQNQARAKELEIKIINSILAKFQENIKAFALQEQQAHSELQLQAPQQQQLQEQPVAEEKKESQEPQATSEQPSGTTDESQPKQEGADQPEGADQKEDASQEPPQN